MVFSQFWRKFEFVVIYEFFVLIFQPLSCVSATFLAFSISGAESQGPLGQEKEPGERCQERGMESSGQNKEQEKGQGGENQEKEALLKTRRKRQRVVLNGKASRWHEVTASIIQGSCLGPNLAKCFSNTSHVGRSLVAEDKLLVSKFADDEKRCQVVMRREHATECSRI